MSLSTSVFWGWGGKGRLKASCHPWVAFHLLGHCVMQNVGADGPGLIQQAGPLRAREGTGNIFF